MSLNRDNHDFDVIVIGGGHAGTEAAHASARILGKSGRKIRFCLSIPHASVSCLLQPRDGWVGEGPLIKEIDALGGIMGMITDQSAIQYKKLNASKGPAVRSSRAQCDKALLCAKYAKFPRENPRI